MIRRLDLTAIAIMVAILLSSCTHYSLVETKPQSIDRQLKVENPQIQWSRMARGKIEIWTIDGPTLQAVRFYKGIEDGETLLPIRSDDANLPVYRRDMLATEVMEFFVDSLIAAERSGWHEPNLTSGNFAAESLRPYDLNGKRGFRFEIRFTARNGLEYEGFVVGINSEEKLYLISYSGARQYYYPKYKKAAEKLIDSIRFPA
jgi:hypothetical protein